MIRDLGLAPRRTAVGDAILLKRGKKDLFSTDRGTNDPPLEKPSRRGARTAVLNGLLIALASTAIILASMITLYAIFVVTKNSLHVALPFNLPEMPGELTSNLGVGAAFFWLEVSAIVIGARLIEQRLALQLAKRQLYSIQEILSELINDLDDERYNFACALDAGFQEDGRYDVNFFALNGAVNDLKNRFIERIFCDIELSPTAVAIVDRILRLLDLYSDDAYAHAERAETLNRDNPAMLDDCLNQYLGRLRTQGLRNIAKMVGSIRQTL